jgi:hypothetical protein
MAAGRHDQLPSTALLSSMHLVNILSLTQVQLLEKRMNSISGQQKKGALQNERIAARPLSMRFGVVMAAKSARTVENLTVQAHLNWRCLVFATPGVDIILFSCLC